MPTPKVNKKGKITTINRRATQLLNIKSDEWIGKSVRELLRGEYFRTFAELIRMMNEHKVGYIQKELSSYGPKKDLNRKYVAPIHIRIIKKSKIKINPGQYFSYVITDGKPLDGISSDKFNGNWDREYYWSHRIFPALSRVVLTAFPNVDLSKI